jgi:hypothetical protein
LSTEVGFVTHDVFISYAEADRRQAVLLSQALQASGIRLWPSTEELPPSQAAWRDVVQAGIASSGMVLIVLSSDWAKSQSCRWELAVALERRTPIIAVAIPVERQLSSLVPRDVDVIDGNDDLHRAVTYVAAHLAQRRAALG